jgi:hypothetical protein
MNSMRPSGDGDFAAPGRDCGCQPGLRSMNSMKALLTKQVLVLFPGLPLVLATALCAGSASSLAAQLGSSGPVGFSFTSPNVPVYDLTGSYQFNHGIKVAGGATVNLALGCSLVQDAAGRLKGAGVTNVQVGGDSLTAQYSVTGTVTGGGGKATRASLSARWVVQNPGGGVTTSTISVQYNLQVNLGFLDGTGQGQAKLAGLGTRTISAPVTGLPLPAGADGSWNVAMNLQPPGGTSLITLPNGRSLLASPRVTYSTSTGLERVTLSGVGTNVGTSLTINFFPAANRLDSLSGKVLGQTVTVKSAGGGTVVQPVGTIPGTTGSGSSQLCLECHSPIAQTVNQTAHRGQCEGCHGSAANHAANDYDPASRPNLNLPLSGTSCGACHAAIYRDWSTSGHPGCPTCHEPHQRTGFPALLRGPLYSTNDYVSTSVTTTINSSVNVCAQCHNDHGASWTTSSTPPSQSPQYNMLLGTVGELDSGPSRYDPGSHALFITNQCAGCHMQSTPYLGPTQPATTGHTFVMASYGICAGCHGSAANASNLVVFVSGSITNQIELVQASLNQWAITKAPAILGTARYGKRAWEYTLPGSLSPGGPGPTPTLQARIPANIQKARFNLYLALYDGSLGVHNPLYTLTLLETAQAWVDQALQ